MSKKAKADGKPNSSVICRGPFFFFFICQCMIQEDYSQKFCSTGKIEQN